MKEVVTFKSVEDFLDSRFRQSPYCLVLDVCLPGNIGGFLKIKARRIDMNTHKEIPIVSKILVCLLFVTALLFAAGVSARGANVLPANKVAHRVCQAPRQPVFQTFLQPLDSTQ